MAEKRMPDKMYRRRRRRGKCGYYTLEAVIFLPIFIVAVLTFAYLIKAEAADEQIIHAMSDEGHRLSMTAYSEQEATTFPLRLYLRLKNASDDAENLILTDFDYLFSRDGIDDLIYVSACYKVDIKLPKRLYDSLFREQELLFRGFTGREHAEEAAGFSSMETAEDYEEVWVFPRAGEKYHEKNCDFINVCARKAKLNMYVKIKYSPCQLCEPGKLASGSDVYYFDTGHVYHSGDCYIVERYVISMDKQDAEKKGYEACSKCGG